MPIISVTVTSDGRARQSLLSEPSYLSLLSVPISMNGRTDSLLLRTLWVIRYRNLNYTGLKVMSRKELA